MIKKLNEISEVFEKRLVSNNIRGYAVTMNLENLHEKIKTDARFSSGDINTGAISIQLLLNGEPVILEENMLVYANIETGRRNNIYQSCQIIDLELGIVMLNLKTQAMLDAGEHTLEIVVQASEDEKLISPKLIYEVFESLDSQHHDPAENEASLATQLISEVAVTNANIQSQENIRVSNEEVRVANELVRQQKMQQSLDLYNNQIVISNAEIDTIIANALK